MSKRSKAKSTDTPVKSVEPLRRPVDAVQLWQFSAHRLELFGTGTTAEAAEYLRRLNHGRAVNAFSLKPVTAPSAAKLAIAFPIGAELSRARAPARLA